MTNRIINIRNERDLAVSETIRELQLGNPVVFPTDTVYGIGALSSDKESVKKIFAIKGRSFTQSLPVLVADFNQAAEIAVADSIPEEVKKFWPGPLSMVLPKSEKISNIVTAGGPTVAVRSPSNPIMKEILEQCKEKFPHIPVELSFETPNYKIQAGRFKEKLNGLKTLDTLKYFFPSAFLLSRKD